ncbi:hypothetical protein [Micromonospora maris]|uniref:hypothetical protein n=1 Tax=Micromonospora maris TaxID=1003110 RepID=UPI00130521B5|nr:hypothetical protein [Micromonospora maris]
MQISSGGQSQDDGVVVLDDSRAPAGMVMQGPWRLRDELLAAGTVLQTASNARRFSARAKGWPLDEWAKRADAYGDGHRVVVDRAHVVGSRHSVRSRSGRSSRASSAVISSRASARVRSGARPRRSDHAVRGLISPGRGKNERAHVVVLDVPVNLRAIDPIGTSQVWATLTLRRGEKSSAHGADAEPPSSTLTATERCGSHNRRTSA